MALMAMADVKRMVGGAAERLRAMRDGVTAFTGEIETLEKDRRKATGREAVRIDQRLRDLKAQRAAADELVVAAEAQAADASTRLTEATKAAIQALPTISSEMASAAERFDRALDDAMAALDELERAGAPIEGLLTASTIRRTINWPVIWDAIQAHFKPRMGGLGDGQRFTTMAGKVALVLDAAKLNAAKLAKSNYRWGGNE